MATKKEIKDDIVKAIGNFPTAGAVAGYLGMSRNTANKYLEGVPTFRAVGDGKRHYLAIDLANRLKEMEVAE